MAVVEIPKLPPLMVVGQGKYKYVSTYKIAWDCLPPVRRAPINKTRAGTKTPPQADFFRI